MKKKIALLLTGTMVAGLFGGVMNVAADDSAEKIKITYMEWGDETRLKAAEEAFEDAAEEETVEETTEETVETAEEE